MQGLKHNFAGLASCLLSRKKHYLGFSLVELLIVIAIIGTIASIAVAIYRAALEESRRTRTIGDIKAIEADLILHYTQTRTFPESLAEVGHGQRRDPWGTPYQYLSFATIKGKGKMRKDRFLVPINSDYDLYSMGPDRRSAIPLTAKNSRDDIIRANDGGFVGPAWEY
jgi:general secretion pathway protein G